MSKLQELIDRLCPNGVEFSTLGEIAEIRRGIRVVKSELQQEGNIPVYQNSLTPLGYYDKSNYNGDTTFVIGAGAAGDIGYSAIPYWGADDCYSIICSKNIISKFVYYLLANNQIFLKSRVRTASIPRLSRNAIEQFPIPIPPIEVQEEIVRILDTFSAHAAELQAELQARKEQYEYYRNLLLTFNPSAFGCGTDGEQKINDVTTWGGHSYTITRKTMGEIGKIKMCKRIMKHQTSSVGEIPFYKIGTFGKEADAFISRDLFEEFKSKFSYPTKGTILISAAGTIGRCVIYNGEDAYFQDSNIVWLENDESQILNSFLYHYFQVVDWETAGGTIKRLYNDRFAATPIPILPIELQEKIVAILDRFETLVNDLTNGLPAEIAAVKEQYEYYRNKLLTFKEIA